MDNANRFIITNKNFKFIQWPQTNIFFCIQDGFETTISRVRFVP